MESVLCSQVPFLRFMWLNTPWIWGVQMQLHEQTARWRSPWTQMARPTSRRSGSAAPPCTQRAALLCYMTLFDTISCPWPTLAGALATGLKQGQGHSLGPWGSHAQGGPPYERGEMHLMRRGQMVHVVARSGDLAKYTAQSTCGLA